MLESVVSSVLSAYLGRYVEGLDQVLSFFLSLFLLISFVSQFSFPKKVSLSMGISSGNVQLSNLRIRLDALKDLNLPLAVRAGLFYISHSFSLSLSLSLE